MFVVFWYRSSLKLQGWTGLPVFQFSSPNLNVIVSWQHCLNSVCLLLHHSFSFHWECPNGARQRSIHQRALAMEATANQHHCLQETQLAAAELPGEELLHQRGSAWDAGSWRGGQPGLSSATASPQSLPGWSEILGNSAATASTPAATSGLLPLQRLETLVLKSSCGSNLLRSYQVFVDKSKSSLIYKTGGP